MTRTVEILPRYFLQLAYDGTPYRGWQRQPAAPSVQEEVEKALRIALHAPDLFVVGCGRTDTGVHALDYYLHFDAPSEQVIDERLVYSLNSMLPESIAIKRVIPVSDDAHARFSATERGYQYLILRRKDAFMADRAHVLHPALDIAAMNTACTYLIGRQDFSSFCKAGSDVKTTFCDVRLAEWEEMPNGYRFRIRADRFLRNMVRAIVGTCIRIGKGQAAPDSMRAVIDAHDRSAAGKSAPARGLYLEHIIYPFIPAGKA
ncbi:MAG TPA: tRNA pseudouridine(38-40) synthase TruA [Flavobacteriales bacterium]|nr:tRNA pseudouridine(38-40) synthase TruA [Flavobacteriales bacterium]HNU56494.1 tRNA pseudouridine(38-40) synthase TruA [Flavobacteriales bacterium]